MPSAIYEVYPPDLYPPEEVWARYWANCDIEREVALCGKRQVVSHILPILRTLDHPLIVDCGCGAGPWVLYLQRLGFENVIGVDNYVPALKKLDALGGQAKEGDVLHLPFDDESVDVCLSFGVAEHFPENPTACLREMERILVPGGYMFLTVPYYSWVRRLAAHPMRSAYIWAKRIPRQFSEYRFREREIADFCRVSGFEVLHCTTDDYEPTNMSLGLYTDFPFLRAGKSGELNGVGVLVSKTLRSLSPRLTTSGILVIARKRRGSLSPNVAEPAKQA